MEDSSTEFPRLISYKQLRNYGVQFSREHLWRLEAAGKFPRRIYLSTQKIAWPLEEVLEWLRIRLEDRSKRKYRKHD